LRLARRGGFTRCPHGGFHLLRTYFSPATCILDFLSLLGQRAYLLPPGCLGCLCLPAAACRLNARHHLLPAIPAAGLTTPATCHFPITYLRLPGRRVGCLHRHRSYLLPGFYRIPACTGLPPLWVYLHHRFLRTWCISLPGTHHCDHLTTACTCAWDATLPQLSVLPHLYHSLSVYIRRHLFAFLCVWGSVLPFACLFSYTCYHLPLYKFLPAADVASYFVHFSANIASLPYIPGCRWYTALPFLPTTYSARCLPAHTALPALGTHCLCLPLPPLFCHTCRPRFCVRTSRGYRYCSILYAFLIAALSLRLLLGYTMPFLHHRFAVLRAAAPHFYLWILAALVACHLPACCLLCLQGYHAAPHASYQGSCLTTCFTVITTPAILPLPPTDGDTAPAWVPLCLPPRVHCVLFCLPAAAPAPPPRTGAPLACLPPTLYHCHHLGYMPGSIHHAFPLCHATAMPFWSATTCLLRAWVLTTCLFRLVSCHMLEGGLPLLGPPHSCHHCLSTHCLPATTACLHTWYKCDTISYCHSGVLLLCTCHWDCCLLHCLPACHHWGCRRRHLPCLLLHCTCGDSTTTTSHHLPATTACLPAAGITCHLPIPPACYLSPTLGTLFCTTGFCVPPGLPPGTLCTANTSSATSVLGRSATTGSFTSAFCILGCLPEGGRLARLGPPLPASVCYTCLPGSAHLARTPATCVSAPDLPADRVPRMDGLLCLPCRCWSGCQHRAADFLPFTAPAASDAVTCRLDFLHYLPAVPQHL